MSLCQGRVVRSVWYNGQRGEWQLSNAWLDTLMNIDDSLFSLYTTVDGCLTVDVTRGQA